MLTRRVFLQLLPALLDWSYGPNRGPDRWGQLSADYDLCGSGQRQSPITLDLATAEVATPAFDYRPTSLNLFNNGRTVQQRCSSSSLGLGEQRYELLQFHFHTPSEHRWGEQGYPLEIHFVHRSVKTRALAVVGIGVAPGAISQTLAQVLAAWPAPGQRRTADTLIEPVALLPKDTRFICYSGSLTTPPCSEDVIWLLADQSITAGPEQLHQLAQRLGHNARPLQQRL